ncbi:hypothetical protein QFC20_001077 [Naganishia adeliensis]|uniref:Uncharacterized protein n=1 Tax=Naganishia adeliensis TaxID=92952 RepID=A0ACC2WTX3_9TREE|nr:hypothetical protein QFC20_001077 [Naganishia adeliensis]
MAICANPRNNHFTHLALLGTLLFFECLSMALSAAFIARRKSQHYGYYFESSALVLAANVLTIVATTTLLGKATLAFSWISTFVLASLQAFLFVWICVHRKRQPEISAYKSNIKAHYVEGEMGSRGNDTVMANIAPTAASVATSRRATLVMAAEPANVQST